jgi:hypothetical protein
MTEEVKGAIAGVCLILSEFNPRYGIEDIMEEREVRRAD